MVVFLLGILAPPLPFHKKRKGNEKQFPSPLLKLLCHTGRNRRRNKAGRTGVYIPLNFYHLTYHRLMLFCPHPLLFYFFFVVLLLQFDPDSLSLPLKLMKKKKNLLIADLIFLPASFTPFIYFRIFPSLPTLLSDCLYWNILPMKFLTYFESL